MRPGPHPARPIQYEVHTRTVESGVDLSSLAEVVASHPDAAIIGGNDSVGRAGRFSIFAMQPSHVLQLGPDTPDPLAAIEAYLAVPAPVLPPDMPAGLFAGGWIGFFSYDLGRHIEKLPDCAIDDLRLPLARLAFYDHAICYDHQNGIFRLVVAAPAGEPAIAGRKFGQLEALLETARTNPPVPEPRFPASQSYLDGVRSNMKRADYRRTFEAIQRHIRDGDVYQINLSQRFECDFNARPIDLFHWQSRHNPSPFAAYIAADDFALVSASPEMFLTVRHGRISTKPIKGTRPRVTAGPDMDERNQRNLAELLQSPKEQAELNMIVDLERNDIARVCKPGTRHVAEPRTIEAYPTVFHAVATIAGELARPQKPGLIAEILRAAFPGGSITGAPKVAAMTIIEQLEPLRRGPYTGSIGYIGLDGSIQLNIAIRTAVIVGDKAYVQTGGGIVADSDCDAEYDETLVKARALIEGIEAVSNPQ